MVGEKKKQKGIKKIIKKVKKLNRFQNPSNPRITNKIKAEKKGKVPKGKVEN